MNSERDIYLSDLQIENEIFDLQGFLNDRKLFLQEIQVSLDIWTPSTGFSKNSLLDRKDRLIKTISSLERKINSLNRQYITTLHNGNKRQKR